MRYHLWRRVKVAIVETGSLLSFSVTSLVQLTRMGSLAEFLDKCKSLLGIAAGLGLASPCSDQELICVVGLSVGYLLKKSARWWCQIGSLEPFVADKLMVSNGVIGAICSWHLDGFTRRCLLTCDKAGTGDWQPLGLSITTTTTVRPC